MEIEFLLNGEVVRLEGVPATLTLLDWLREARGLTGTKEGCNEGDCGACSVVVTDGRGPRALNACILLVPQLHGAAVRTVEGIAGPGGEPHPVQSAMVAHHGSQCGFCTPGFVATMAAAHAAGRRDHDDQLAGCLCRCTGYAPIVRAARAVEGAPVPGWMVENLSRLEGGAPSGPRPGTSAASGTAGGAADAGPGASVEGHPWEAPLTRGEDGARRGRSDPAIASEASPIGDAASDRRDPSHPDPSTETGRPGTAPPSHASVPADWGHRDPVAGTGASDAVGSTEEGAEGEAEGGWVRPRHSDELAAWLLEHPDATLVAGATDVGLWVTKGLRGLGRAAFLAGCEDLRGVTVGADEIRIGATASVEAVREALAPLHPALGEVLRRYGSVQVRHAATIGGNVANGSPIGDSPPLLIALGAALHLRRGKERRAMALEDFFLDYGRQDRRPGEFVEAITVPRQADRLRAYKLSKRFDQDISAVCGAFRITVADGVVAEARIAFGGLAATPRRAAAAEAALAGRPWDEAAARRAMDALGSDFAPISDMRASAEYRLEAARGMLLRCWMEERGAAVSVLEVTA